MKKLQVRQGDVFIQQIEEIPKEATLQEKQPRVILAYGEVTGHHHSIKQTKKVKAYKATGEEATYLEIADALALLEHQEHETIKLPAGNYKAFIQREYSPSEIRRVAD